MKIFYCDGSTKGKNQKGADNYGGFGVVCLEDDEEILSMDAVAAENTTNNREELKALIYALAIAEEEYPDEECLVFCDSAYVVNMFNDWIHSWAKNGWKNSKKQTVENLDLVLQLWEYAKQDFFHCIVKRCDGHMGEFGNEVADALATMNFRRVRHLINENEEIQVSGMLLDWLDYEEERAKSGKD